MLFATVAAYVVAAILCLVILAVLCEAHRALKNVADRGTDEHTRQAVRDAIAYAENNAAKLRKSGIRVSSAQKLRVAIARLRDRAPKMSDEQASMLIEQELPKVGFGAIAHPAPAAVRPSRPSETK